MSWLHCFWGVGAMISPYIMSYALVNSYFGDGYKRVSLIQFIIFLVLLLALPLWKKMPKKGGEEGGEAPIKLSEALKTKGVVPILLAFMAYCSAEATAMLWASSYLEHSFEMTKDRAAALGSLFFIGITLGRFLSGFISERLGDRRLIDLGSLIAILGVLLTAIPLETVAIAGFIILGLGCAPIYPSIIHSTPVIFGEEKSQSIIGVQMASAYFGSTFMPPLFGLIANHIDISLMPLYLGAFLLAMLIFITRSRKILA